MKKSKAICLLALSTVCSLASCGKGNSSQASSVADSSSQEQASSSEAGSSSSQGGSSESSAVDTPVTSITYGGKDITLGEHALYLNQSLKEAQLSTYAFNSLKEVAAKAADGTSAAPTVVYLAPDVYWTDDYTSTDIRASDNLIGLSFKQSYLTMIGMSDDYNDTVIASDRGQNAGANGNFNTIGLGYAFTAENITFGNYCNVDLVYKKDASKNHAKRQEGITQAQTITNAAGASKFDKWYFDNCSFVSRLNLLAGSPVRSYFKDCHLECTDDSLSMGKETIFDSCDIELHANHPTWSAASNLQAFLNCSIVGKLDSDDHELFLCKYVPGFTLIDTDFSGNIESIEWANPDDASIKNTQNMIYNCNLNGEQLRVSEDTFPEATYVPTDDELKAFRLGKGSYNIYNLLNSVGYEEEFDPLGQKNKTGYEASPWNIELSANSSILEGNGSVLVRITASVLGGDGTQKVSFSSDVLDVQDNKNNTADVSFTNAVYKIKSLPVYATLPNGIKRVIYLTVYPTIGTAPSLAAGVSLDNATTGYIKASYAFAKPEDVNDENYDMSDISWYSASDVEGTDKLLVGGSTFVKAGSAPSYSYALKGSDVGKYIICAVKPQLRFTNQGLAMTKAFTTKITEAMVLDANKKTIATDFSDFAYNTASNDTAENNYEWKDTLQSGYFYGGTYLPKEYRTGGDFVDKKFVPNTAEKAWTYAYGTAGSADVVGLQTTTQGARLVYKKAEATGAMDITVNLAPAKTSCQGFGSAKQYLDTFIKYDPVTQNGYGLRIMRIGTTDDANYKDYVAKSCRFSLMKYTDGVSSELGTAVIATAYQKHVTIKLSYKDKVLSADVSTDAAQDSAYPEYMSNHPVLTYTLTEDDNTFGGFGFQCTGTAGAGKDGNRTTISNLKAEY